MKRLSILLLIMVFALGYIPPAFADIWVTSSSLYYQWRYETGASTYIVYTSASDQRYTGMNIEMYASSNGSSGVARVEVYIQSDGIWVKQQELSYSSTNEGWEDAVSANIVFPGAVRKIQINVAYSGGGSRTSVEVRGAIACAEQAPDNADMSALEIKVDNAKNSADTASARALNAYNSVYNSNGNTITAVRDSSGTVLSEARQARTNAQNAYNTAQTVNTKIDALSTAVTNIQNNIGVDASPPEIQITTVSGALATSGNTIKAVIDASDNVSTLFDYSLDGTAYHTLPNDGAVELPVINPGTNLITVWVKDEAGNTGRDSITIRKL